MILSLSPNKPLQRSGIDKVFGCGRGNAVLEQVLRAPRANRHVAGR